MPKYVVSCPMQKKETIAEWMQRHALTIDGMAFHIKYSTTSIANWRQNKTYPGPRAEKTIRRRWSDFPDRPSRPI